MNKKIYKGYELVKAIEDGEIKEGTILIFTSTISKDNKKEVEVVRRPEGLNLYKKDAAEILPTSWLFNSKIEVLEDNTEKIEELDTLNAYKLMESPYMVKLLKEQRYGEFMEHLKQSEVEIANTIMKAEDKINELAKAVNQITINLAKAVNQITINLANTLK